MVSGLLMLKIPESGTAYEENSLGRANISPFSGA
jgi:hypothetical protein